MRRFRFLIVVLAIGLTVAGCGEGDSGPTSTKPTGPAETVKGTTTTTEAPASTETGKGTTSTTTTAADVPASDGPPADDAYIGTVSVPDEYAEMAEVLDSRVEVSISDGTANMTIDFTFEAVWVGGDDNNEPCISTDHWVLTGTGPALPTMDVDLYLDSYEVLEISGCERDEDEDDDESIPFSGSVANGTVTGTFFSDLFVVTAEPG